MHLYWTLLKQIQQLNNCPLLNKNDGILLDMIPKQLKLLFIPSPHGSHNELFSTIFLDVHF
jgi:hypothetical protein